MGQRAVFATKVDGSSYKDAKENHNVHYTTVQWSTGSDVNLYYYFGLCAQDGLTHSQAVSSLTQPLLGFGHISSFAIYSEEEKQRYGCDSDYLIAMFSPETVNSFFQKVDPDFHTDSSYYVFFTGTCPNFDNGSFDTVEDDKLLGVDKHFHARDGISVILDATNADSAVEFYLADGYDYISDGRSLEAITPDHSIHQLVEYLID